MSDRIEMLKKALEKDPNNPLGLFGLASEYYKNQQFTDAIEILEKYLELHEDEGSGYRMLAQCYTNIGELERAIETYEKGIEKAVKFNHPSMVEEFRQEIEQLKMMM